MDRDDTPHSDDLDGGRISRPDLRHASEDEDHDVAEAALDVIDTFRTSNVGRDLGPGGIATAPDDARDSQVPERQPTEKKTRSTNQ